MMKWLVMFQLPQTGTKLDVPLMFWFNRNPGLALPLIALQYHEVKLNLDIEADNIVYYYITINFRYETLG